MTPVHLLDASAVIALTLTDHEHHHRAASWASAVDRIALCPIVEGSLARFLIRLGQTATTAKLLLDAMYASPRCEFWPDSLSYGAANLDHVTGHQQVTDAYLATLAASNNGVLATFDRALARAVPEHVVLIP